MTGHAGSFAPTLLNSSENSRRSPTVAPAARKSSTPCLEPSGLSGSLTISTTSAPPVEILGQGPLGPENLDLRGGVRVEADVHLPADEMHVIPIGQGKAVALPAP